MQVGQVVFERSRKRLLFSATAAERMLLPLSAAP